MAGGALTTAPEKDEICKAFEAATNDWCKLSPEERKKGHFNDYFFDHLKGKNPPGSNAAGSKIADQMQREVGGLFGRGGSFQGLTKTLARGSGTDARVRIARQMEDAAEKSLLAGGSMGAAQGSARSAAWAAQGVSNPTKFFKDLAALRKAKAPIPGPMLGKLKRCQFYPRFADAMYQGKAFEIKGPGDRFHGAQAKDLKTMSGGSDPYVASCESCGLKCRSGCPKSLPVQRA